MVDLSMLGIPDNIVTFIGAIIVVFLVILLALHLYVALVLFELARKTKTPNEWLAFIPISNVYLMAKIAGLSGWYTTSLALALVPYIGGFITTATFAYIWLNIARRMGRPGWWGLMVLVPVINLIYIGMMAWGKEVLTEQEARVENPPVRYDQGNA